MEKKNVVAVLGYGCHLHKKMESYLATVAYQSAVTLHPEIIICSGGFTNPRTVPGTSEAQMMGEYLEKRIRIPIIREEKSWSTTENIRNIRRILAEQKMEDAGLTIFCNEAHRVKVMALSYAILGYLPMVYGYPIFGGTKEKLKQTVIATPISVVGLYVPAVARWETNRRLTIISKS
ncbi:MAG: YdcF family protein [Patescibacteria group bacterium]